MIEEISPNVQRDDFTSKNIENDEMLTNNLISKIETLENKQAHQMEYLTNTIQTLEEYRQSDTNFRKEYDDKITNLIENKFDIDKLRNVMYSELQIIRYEFEKLHELYSKLQSCCNSNAASITNQDIEKQVENILLRHFPSGTSREDLTRIIRNLFESHGKEDQIGLKSSNTDVQMSDERVRKIVKEILQIYDADKTGQVDYALESAGGQIISTRCTQRYDIKSRTVSLFGYPLYYESNNPRTVIQGNTMQPGVCWAFQDFPGYLLIQLRSFIYVTGFTLEHVSRLILPDENISSAPRKFNVWGLTEENDPEPVMFGDYEFNAYSDDNLQYFPVQNTEIDKPYQYIELRIHSNHGQLEYTCLYRFRVHGRIA